MYETFIVYVCCSCEFWALFRGTTWIEYEMLDFHDAEDFSCGPLTPAVYSASCMLTYRINMLPVSSWLK